MTDSLHRIEPVSAVTEIMPAVMVVHALAEMVREDHSKEKTVWTAQDLTEMATEIVTEIVTEIMQTVQGLTETVRETVTEMAQTVRASIEMETEIQMGKTAHALTEMGKEDLR